MTSLRDSHRLTAPSESGLNTMASLKTKLALVQCAMLHRVEREARRVFKGGGTPGPTIFPACPPTPGTHPTSSG